MAFTHLTRLSTMLQRRSRSGIKVAENADVIPDRVSDGDRNGTGR